MTPEILAPDIAWDPSGHLSEVALSVAADGEYTLFDGTMSAHLGSCEACAAQLGHVALRSARVAEAFAIAPAAAAIERPATAPVQRPALATTRRKVPFLAIAAALVVALLGALPSLLSVPERLSHTLGVARKVAPSFLRLAPEAAHRMWDGGSSAPRLLVTWALALALLAMGVAIAKKASKKMILDGGRQ